MSTALLAVLGIARPSRVEEAKKIHLEAIEALDDLNSTLEEIASAPQPFHELVKRVKGAQGFGPRSYQVERRRQHR